MLKAGKKQLSADTSYFHGYSTLFFLPGKGYLRILYLCVQFGLQIGNFELFTRLFVPLP